LALPLTLHNASENPAPPVLVFSPTQLPQLGLATHPS